MNLSLIKAGITSEGVHYWAGTSFKPSIMLDFQFVTFESECKLRQFFDIDDAINFLFLNGFKDSARELNKLKANELDRKVKLYILTSVSDQAESNKPIEIIKYIEQRFYSEMQWSVNQVGEQSTMMSWLQGLALNIAFCNCDILQLAIEWGYLAEDATEAQQGKILDNYWQMMSAKTLQLIRQYRVLKTEEV